MVNKAVMNFYDLLHVWICVRPLISAYRKLIMVKAHINI